MQDATARGPASAPRLASIAALVLALGAGPAAALASVCALADSVFEPIDATGAFTMSVAREGDGFRFVLTSLALRRTTRFLGTYQNGTGHLILTEAVEDRRRGARSTGPSAISSRVLLLRADLRTTDPWNEGPVPVAYALFEGLADAMWGRARFHAEDNRPGASPPDGMWRVLRCGSR